ncbi:MAG: acetyl-CoA carboxylase biotin carboxyl carrier protein subunit [Deltaproteobacteria bacterium]|jgi:biotin carboxyl carrier protein|nr:acetyl-CoA carboxylase biotin carboxyl carrier protein subunit [Deltaproteobacteria bacterium]
MAREWIATVGSGRDEVEVTVVRRSGGELLLRIGESEHEVDAAEVANGTWSVLVGQRSYLVDVGEGQEASVLVGSAELAVVVEDARRKRLAEAVGAGSSASGELLRAPIAGRVVKVLVEVGTEVEPGASVVVLEAMKMENEIKATRGGVVESISVEAGQSVESNQALVNLS